MQIRITGAQGVATIEAQRVPLAGEVATINGTRYVVERLESVFVTDDRGHTSEAVEMVVGCPCGSDLDDPGPHLPGCRFGAPARDLDDEAPL